MKKEIILDKRKAVEIIFYNGVNKNDVIEFFKDRNYGKFLVIIDNELHYKKNSYDSNTLIKPNLFLSFKYDEDDWWYISKETKENFDKHFVSVTIDS